MQLAIAGAGGRMGRELIRIITQTDHVKLVAAFEHQGSPWLGKNAQLHAGLESGAVFITDNMASISERIDAIIDFTSPQSSLSYAAFAAQHHLIHIIGTTGFSPPEELQIAQFASNAVIVKSGNMSLGINLLADFAKQAAATLTEEECDIEILEMHHRHKRDAPSGTALLLGESVAQGREIALDLERITAHHQTTGPRQNGDIGFATLRGGSVVGEHSVIFASNGERIILTHIAEDRSIFARGALKAALWAQNKPYGLYSMKDVLNPAFNQNE